MPAARQVDPDLLEADALGARHRPDGDEHVAALHLAAVLEGHDDPVAAPLGGGHPGPVEDRHPAAAEDVLDDRGRVLVLLGQDELAGGDEGDVGAEPEIRLCELGAGDAGPDDDEPLRQLGQVVELLPGEDPLPVRLRGRQHPRGGSRRDEHDVGVHGLRARVGLGEHPGGAHHPAAAAHHPHPDLAEPGGDVAGLGLGQIPDAGVDGAQLGPGAGQLIPFVVLEAHAELRGRLEAAEVVGGPDEGLARDHVGEDRRPSQAVAVDDRDVGAEVRGDESRLVASGATSEDHHRCRVCHSPIQSSL